MTQQQTVLITGTTSGIGPRFRYRVGFQATFLPVFKELLPWSAFAGRVRKVFDVDGPAGRDPGPVPNEVPS